MTTKITTKKSSSLVLGSSESKPVNRRIEDLICGMREGLKKYLLRKISVDSVYASYEFAEVRGEKIRCGYWEVHYRSYRILRAVESHEIVIDDTIDYRGVQTYDHIPLALEIRYPGAYFLHGINDETYSIEMISEIEVNGKVIFRRKPEDNMPDDIKEKYQTYKSVPLPPAMD